MYPNLMAEIARRGWTVSYLAELLGVAPSKLSAQLNGKQDFKLKEARRIQEVLGVDIPIDELFKKVES